MTEQLSAGVEAIRAKLGVLSEADAAQLLGLAPATLRNWRSARQGPRFIKIGVEVFYRVSAIEQWMAEQEAESLPPRPAPRRRA